MMSSVDGLPAASTVTLLHMRLEIALHCLRDGDGPPLLMLHGLGERSTTVAPPDWNGAVWAMDFAGHGDSGIAVGGGYVPESLVSEVDAVLAYIGPATIVGRGLGAYVATLIAGARPQLVCGIILRDGPGLHGGGPTPGTPVLVEVAGHGELKPDPLALLELANDVRPADYITRIVDLAVAGGSCEPRIAVAARLTCEWLDAVRSHGASRTMTLTDAYHHYSR